MRTFVLDTATSSSYFALFEGEVPLFSVFLPKEGLPSEAFFPLLERELLNANLELSSIDLIGCGQGPGSYTGMRVAATIAKTLSFALNIPLAPFCSLAPFLIEDATPCAAVLDARAGGIYMYQKGMERPLQIENEALQTTVLPPILTSPEPETLKKKFATFYPAYNGSFLLSTPHLETAYLLANKAPKSIGELELFYLKKTQAERNL